MINARIKLRHMTIAAAYLVSEGVVFGADSTTTVSSKLPDNDGATILQALNHAQKVFEVGHNSRLGLCTWGAGIIGDVSHRTVAARLSEQIKPDTGVKEASDILTEIVKPIVDESETDFVGYYLGGWNPGTHIPKCFQIQFQAGQDPFLDPLKLGMCHFSGNQ